MFIITSYVYTDLSVIKYMFVRSCVRSLLVFCSIICLVKDKLVEAWTARVGVCFEGCGGVGSGLGAGKSQPNVACTLHVGIIAGNIPVVILV